MTNLKDFTKKNRKRKRYIPPLRNLFFPLARPCIFFSFFKSSLIEDVCLVVRTALVDIYLPFRSTDPPALQPNGPTISEPRSISVLMKLHNDVVLFNAINILFWEAYILHWKVLIRQVFNQTVPRSQSLDLLVKLKSPTKEFQDPRALTN